MRRIVQKIFPIGKTPQVNEKTSTKIPEREYFRLVKVVGQKLFTLWRLIN